MINYEQLYYDFFMYLNDLQFSVTPDEWCQGDQRILRENLVEMLKELKERMIYMRDKMAGGDLYGKT